MSNVFRALATRNYRLYFGGQLVSLVGTWMHIVAQSWLVLRLSGSGFAVGLATALQFGPMLIGGVWGGLVADRLPKRKILLVTQSLFAIEALALGTLVASGAIELWMVFAFAFAYGVIQVVDVPARQSFVPEMVGDNDVMNAVSLNSAVFNAARMAGPAIAGAIIAGVSLAVCFFANAASFIAVLIALALMRERDLYNHHERARKGPGQIRAGLRYVAGKPDLLLPIVLVGVVSTLGLNFQIVLPVLAKFTFDGDARTFGALSAVFAFGCLLGSMYAATRRRPSRKLLVGSALAFGALELSAAFMPTLQTAYVVLPIVGIAGMLFIATANSTVQLNASPVMRGRALSLFSLVLLGSTPVGGPVIGWISQTYSPRASLAVGGAATLIASSLIGAYLLGQKRGEAAATQRLADAPMEEDVLVAAEAS